MILDYHLLTTCMVIVIIDENDQMYRWKSNFVFIIMKEALTVYNENLNDIFSDA